MKEKSSRKGISPLIAAVLLIAFTMVVAGIFSGWAPNVLQGIQSGVSEDADRISSCTDARLQLMQVRQEGDDNISFSFQVAGETELENFTAGLFNEEGRAKAEQITTNGLNNNELKTVSLKSPDEGKRFTKLRLSSNSCPNEAQDEIKLECPSGLTGLNSLGGFCLKKQNGYYYPNYYNFKEKDPDNQIEILGYHKLNLTVKTDNQTNLNRSLRFLPSNADIYDLYWKNNVSDIRDYKLGMTMAVRNSTGGTIFRMNWASNPTTRLALQTAGTGYWGGDYNSTPLISEPKLENQYDNQTLYFQVEINRTKGEVWAQVSEGGYGNSIINQTTLPYPGEKPVKIDMFNQDYRTRSGNMKFLISDFHIGTD